MKLLLLSLFVFSTAAFSQVQGLTITNSFQVDKEGYVFRGREPKAKVSELLNIGITDVVIFKNETKTEVQDEMAELERLSISAHHIPFRWKDFPSMIEACEQTVDALNIITKVKAKKGKVYFHCSVGEDRTGMLAGLYRMLEERVTKEAVFKTEMCARGYSDGDVHKPGMVVAAIQKELTPLFLALSQKIESGEWVSGKINKLSCKNIVLKPTKLKCR